MSTDNKTENNPTHDDESLKNENDTSTEKEASPRLDQERVAFEQERDAILQQLSSEYRSMFGRIGFAKWAKMTLPVLILNPYHVPPHPVRQQWLNQFRNYKQVDGLSKLPYLVYWYGTIEMDEAYSFLPSKLITLYENAVKKNIHELPQSLQKKRNDPSKKLTENDLATIRGYEEMKEDLPLEPGERKRGVINFMEDYQIESDDENDDEDESMDDTVKTKKKRKKVKDTQDDEEPAKKRKKVKSKENVKTKIKKDDMSGKKKEAVEKTKIKEVLDDEFGNDEDDDSTKESNKMDAVEEFEQAIAAENSPESEDETDDNYDPPSDVEKKDRNHESRKLVKQPKTKKEKTDRKTQTKEKQEKKQRQKPEKTLSEEELKKRELKVFRRCEERFVPLLERWKKLLASKDVERIQNLLSKILPVVNEFSAIFIEAYDISLLLKETKNVLKLNNAKLDRCVELKEAFRDSYSKKRDSLPKGLKIRKSIGTENERQSSSKEAEKPIREETSAIAAKEEAQLKSAALPQKEPSVAADDPINSKALLNPRSTSPKPPAKKKKFSLTNLMRQAKVDPETDGVTKDSSTHSVSKKVLILPSWMTEGKQETSTLEDPRALALEFLMDMAAYFPASKVNQDSIARALEASIYKEAMKTSSEWVSLYWNKVHILVAAICGKLHPTSLFDLIMNGRFKTADELVRLPEKTLMDAFEGENVVF